jgi:RimJ/RimL family protein N-acetyltransferase
MIREIRGERIILREQRDGDAPYFAYWFSQPDVMFRCAFEKPVDTEEARRYINEYHRSDDSLWFTVTDPEGNIIGETGLLRMFPAWHQTDLTVIIPDPENRRRGYGTEAVSIMLDLAFGKYDMHRVSVGVVAINTEALDFYAKMGFRREGILEEAYLYDGKYSDFVMMRILRHEWQSRTEKLAQDGDRETGEIKSADGEGEKVRLLPLEPCDREQFILDNQRAFNFGALEEFGRRDDHFEEPGEIISRETIEESIDSGEAYLIMYGEQKAGGAVIRTDGDRGDLDLLFVSPEIHSRGIGFAAWREIERLHPEVRAWETVTPYFEKRNIHFYVNRCGFHIVEFYNSRHPDPNDPDGGDDLNDQFPEGMFRFEKRIR